MPPDSSAARRPRVKHQPERYADTADRVLGGGTSHAVYERSLAAAAFSSGSAFFSLPPPPCPHIQSQANCKLVRSEGSKVSPPNCISTTALRSCFALTKSHSPQPAVVQRGVPTQFIEEKQKAYELEKKRISALADRKLLDAGAARDAQPKRAEPYNRERDGGRECSRASEREDVKREHDRDRDVGAGRSSGSRGVSNTPAWMVAERDASKSGEGSSSALRSGRGDEDSRGHRMRASGGGGREEEGRERRREEEGRERRREGRREEERDRSRERDGRRDRSPRQRESRRSRSGSRERGRKERSREPRSNRRDDGYVRRSRRSRSPVVSSSSSGGSLSPASK
jgi:hypothetical protein